MFILFEQTVKGVFINLKASQVTLLAVRQQKFFVGSIVGLGATVVSDLGSGAVKNALGLLNLSLDFILESQQLVLLVESGPKQLLTHALCF